MRNERQNDPPPGVPRGLLDKVEQLKWARYVSSIIEGLPKGKLRESVETELLSLLESQVPLDGIVDELKERVRFQQQQLTSLRKEYDLLEAAYSRDTDVVGAKRRLRQCIGWSIGFTIVSSVCLHFFLKKYGL